MGYTEASKVLFETVSDLFVSIPAKSKSLDVSMAGASIVADGLLKSVPRMLSMLAWALASSSEELG